MRLQCMRFNLDKMLYSLMFMVTVAHACLSSRDRGCLLYKSRQTFDLVGASRTLLKHVLHGPLTNSVFENPAHLLENMEVSNCRTLQRSEFVDCIATLFNIRIRNVRILLDNVNKNFLGYKYGYSPRIRFSISAGK